MRRGESYAEVPVPVQLPRVKLELMFKVWLMTRGYFYIEFLWLLSVYDYLKNAPSAATLHLGTDTMIRRNTICWETIETIIVTVYVTTYPESSVKRNLRSFKS